MHKQEEYMIHSVIHSYSNDLQDMERMQNSINDERGNIRLFDRFPRNRKINDLV